jgi:cytoskeletal protein RodZ
MGVGLKSALIALVVIVVLLVGAGAWLVLWVDDSESANSKIIKVAGDAAGATTGSNQAGQANQNSAPEQASARPTGEATAAQTTGSQITAAQGGPSAAAPPAAAGPIQAYAVPETLAPEDKPTASIEPSPLNGLRISSQSWRRGGLGSKALVTFTLRNENSYAVKHVEIACAFSRQDGSHLTDRTRVVPGPVDMRSRKTFRAVHVGFVNVNASKAKCTLVAASKT